MNNNKSQNLERDIIGYFGRSPKYADDQDGSNIVSDCSMAIRQNLAERLTELSKKESEAHNAKMRESYACWLNSWRSRNGLNAMPRRNPYPQRKSLDYVGVDFRGVIDCADRLVSVYFDDGEWGTTVRDRYIVSVARALEIMNSEEAKKYGCVTLTSGCNWAYNPIGRNSLWTRLNAEKKRFEEQGVWPSDMEALKKGLCSGHSYTISDCLGGNARALTMLAVLARLMVGCAKDEPTLWERDTLFRVYEHILCATMRSYDLAFPFHLDIETDYLRLGRTHDRQTCMVSDYIDGKYYDSSEQIVFGGFVVYYLQARRDRESVWKAIMANERMVKFFSPKQRFEMTQSIKRTCRRTKTNARER